MPHTTDMALPASFLSAARQLLKLAKIRTANNHPAQPDRPSPMIGTGHSHF